MPARRRPPTPFQMRSIFGKEQQMLLAFVVLGDLHDLPSHGDIFG